MDSVFNAAVEEICCEGPCGLHIRDLWPKLIPSLNSLRVPFCEKSKRVILENLVLIPGLKFETEDGTVLSDLDQEFGDDLKIVAAEDMRNGFLGISEIEASVASLSDTQRSILQRLAVARTNGIAQSELGKELRMQPKNLFYPLKTLETLGLIVRVSAIIRKKQASKYSEPVHTNMLYLFRYGKHLSSQQRLEIFIEDKSSTCKEVGEVQTESGVGFGKEVEKEDVHVKDFLPAMEAICEKLEKAQGKVLVVSEIKIDLGYRGSAGHRAWRNIFHRLKDAQVVEECHTVVNKKKVSCLRLLRKLSPSQFEQKVNGRVHDEVDLEQSASLVKRGQITNQLVELPILRQIYETIDVAGSKGLTNAEVCRGLGLCSKEYHKRYFNQRIFKFGLHSQLETRHRNEVYRLYTAGNLNLGSCNTTPDENETVLNKSPELELHDENLSHPKESEHSASIVIEASPDMNVDGEGKSSTLLLQWHPQDFDLEPRNEVPCDELAVSVPNNSAQLEKSLSTVEMPSRVRSHVKYPCLTTSATSLQREQRILKILQEEKFLIKSDLHRRLESLEKEKNTMMDRKTLDRCLNKLQKENQCKCIDVSVPSVTNCSRSRMTVVVLHPSVSNVTTDLLGQIHDKLRTFEIQIRQQQSISRRSNSPAVSTVANVQRVLPSTARAEGGQLERSETMRHNGFVLAKMVRAKLLHVFLWGWVSCSPGWGESLLSNNNPACDMKNPHSTCVLFDLDLAIKSLPLELFLQVVGSAEKIEGMVEKCESGLLLSGLPSQEYKCLMDTRAIGRLSWLIDMLRRLKLIRLVSKDHAEDGAERLHTALAHALEIKPYIEEPASTDFSPGFLFPDLRPQKRHDFVLSSRTTVDEYWSTLEYCYSAAKSRAALLAFPGSVVHEVFRPRSWASVRVMTAGQRDELLKRVATDDPSKKLSFNDCRTIANDLNLNLEQVLRFYYDKRQNRRNRVRRSSDTGREEIYPISRKRRRNSGLVSSEHLPTVNGQSSADASGSLLSSDKHFDDRQQQLINSESSSCQLHTTPASNDRDDQDEPESFEENKETGTLIHRGLSKLNPARRKRFSWTEEADRKLVIEYATHRAALGAKFNRVDWASISDLPAYPDACKRRMSLLRSYDPFRKAVSRLCRMLADRYVQHLKIYPDKMLNGVNSMVDYTFEVDGIRKWNDFDDSDIKEMLDNVLRHKRMAKLQAVKDSMPGQECKVNNDFDDCGETKSLSQRSSRRKLPAKYVKLFNKGATVSRLMHESVAIANAAELFKLIFMSSSTSPELPTVLAETLRRYSEHDLFSAFNYLREKKIMVGGNGKHFVLSRQFLQSICPFTFPTDTGKYAANFATWLHEREKDLMKEGIDIPLDLQCGEIFTLCAKLSSGELSIIACLPDKGVGEAEDNRTSKRKFECGEPESGEKYKKLKNSFVSDGDISSRRDKGFPAIKLSLYCAKVSRSFALESSNDESVHPAKSFDCAPSYDDHMKEMCDSEGSNHFMVNMNESPWEAMSAYARYTMASCSYEIEASYLHPSLFKTLYSAAQKSGDQGLSINEIRKLLNIDDEKMLENVVDVLETFGRVIKVNAYDSIHVIDSLYRSKYFLTSVPPHAITNHPEGLKGRRENENMPFNLDCHINNDATSEREVNPIADEMHRVTILNLREDVDPSEVYSTDNTTGCHKHSEGDPSQMNKRSENIIPGSAYNLTCQPLFPWINGDGTINEPVYSRLIRRILGIVMQNPGILEDGIINHMRCLNPQSCRKLLEIMIMDNHIIPRKMHQMKSTEPPSILGTLLGDCSRKPKLICPVHYFANPMSTSCL